MNNSQLKANWLNNLKIRKKLILAFCILIFFMIVMISYSASQLISTDRTFGNLTDVTSKRQTNLANMLETLYRLEINNITTASLINNDEISGAFVVMSRQEYEYTCGMFLKHIYDYRGHLLEDINLSREVLYDRLDFINHIENLFTEEYEHFYYIILDGVETNNKTQTGEALREAHAMADIMTGQLEYLRDILITHIGIESGKISSYSKQTVYTQFIVAAVIIIMSILVSILMAKKIETPIHRLAFAAMEISGGNLNFPIRSDRLDELGNLSNFIGDMVDSLKKANQAKSDFLANMSHEMRTPLNVVVGLTDMRMDDRNIPPELQDDLRKINTAGALLLGIVNDVLDISKIEAGKLELTPEEYYTASLFNDIITLNMIRIGSKPVNFIVNIDENLPSEMFGDELRVKQIFNNLLSNAFKYTKTGSVTLNVDYALQEGESIEISATVTDTGIGIRPEDIKKLFTDYNQVDMNANRKIEGTGLGLSITKELVEMMNGKITVESEYGKGSSFHLKLRQGYVNSSSLGRETVKNLRNFKYTDEKQNASALLVRPDLSYARVLVVDDHPTNLDVASGMLRKYKMNVDCITSGKDAIGLIKRGEPVYNAIFMDHMMPEMDGIEATQRIRALDSEYAKKIPIISLTANALAGNEQVFLNKGFSAFLSKPINISKLDSIVKKWVRNEAYESGAEKENMASPAYDQDTSQALHIPGVSVEKGLELYGGDMELYMFALGSFISNTPASINAMRNVTKEKLPEYAISVHGLKSVCGAIGAEELRARALKLETISKNGDLEGVLAENDALLRDTEILIADIQKIVKNYQF